MARYDFTARRLFVDAPLSTGCAVALDRAQAHYLRDVLRLSDGAEILIFNGRDGEWRATLASQGRKDLYLCSREMLRAQAEAPDLLYLFAPLKHARLDYMVQKAVEMGCRRLQPVLTRYTQAERINLERMRANAIEAAEQCGILNVPEIGAPRPLADMIAAWEPDRLLVFCDEDAEVADPIAALKSGDVGQKLAILIGPEGGFDPRERAALSGLPHVLRLSLGPRILRADTAAVAALALVQAVLGDWAGDWAGDWVYEKPMNDQRS